MRAVYSLMCVLERDFLFFSVSMVSRSALPFCGIGLNG